MNLTWHIFRKDFVRLRFALGLLVIMLGVEMLLNLRLLSSAAADVQWYGTAEVYANLFTTILRIAVYVLVASLVLDDPLLGTKKMFWVTRPISGGRLLRAKLIGLVLLFFVLPFVVRLPWWLYCGFGWKDLGAMAGIEFAMLIVIGVPAVALASLSGESSKFLLYSLLLVVAIVVTFALAVVFRPGIDSDLSGSRALIGFSLALVSGVMVSVWLYLTRRFVVASVFVGVVAAIVALCLYCWPWTLQQLGAEHRNQLVGAENVSVEIVSAKLNPLRKGSVLKEDYLTLKLRFLNVPDDLVLVSGTAEVELRWPDGTVFRLKRVRLPQMEGGTNVVRHLLGLPAAMVDAETTAKGKELGDRPLTPREAKFGRRQMPPGNMLEKGFSMIAQIPLTAGQLKRIESESPACFVSTRVEVARPEVLLEMPMREAFEGVGAGLRFHFLAMDEDDKNTVEADGRPRHAFNVTVVYATAPTIVPELFEVNRRHGVVERFGGYSKSTSMPLLVAMNRQQGKVAVPQLWRTDRWIDAPDYLADWTLVAVTKQRVGGFNRELHTDRLEITISNPP